MQKITLAVLLGVMIATPCLAEEIEPDGLFSIEGTRWRTCGISASIQFGLGGSGSGFNFGIGCSADSYGFYESRHLLRLEVAKA